MARKRKKGKVKRAKKKVMKKGFDKNFVILAVAVLIVGFMAMQGSAPPEEAEDIPLDTGPVVPVDEAPEEIEEEEVVPELPVQEFSIMAYRYSYAPQSVQVKVGTLVMITLESKDVEHGFVIPEFSVDELVGAKETLEIGFVADRVGTFEFSCGDYCPVGAHNMKGRLIVIP